MPTNVDYKENAKEKKYYNDKNEKVQNQAIA